MMYSMQIAFSLVTLCGIAIIVILRRSYLRYAAKNMKDTIIITPMPTEQAAKKKDVISQQEKDIISALPDDILISIISRMDTKFAVRTSILSKRWRNLYKFVPDDIDFYCQELWCPAPAPYPHHGASMIYKVERFLRLRSHSIRSFNFRCRLTKSHTNRFEQCICYLGRLAVEELLVCFSCCRFFPSCRKYSCCRRSSNLSFSCHLLSEMSSLKYFQLALCSLQPSLKLCQYNSLQTLSLMDVRVLPGALECILSNCLMLHSLIIDRCDCPSKLCFCGPNLLLKSLMIKSCKGVKEIELYASNLTKLEFHNPELAKFICNHVPQLQILYLESYSKNIMSYAFEKFAKYLPHLKSLAFCIQDNFDQESTRLMDMGIQTFSNLRRLHLKVYCTPKTNLLAVLILESCPLLHEFNLDIPYNVEYDGGGAQPRKQVALHSELKKVEISGFEGTKNEIEFPLYILKSAVYLEQMHIIWSFNLYTDSYIMRDISQRHKMMENQLQGQALSKTAKVIIKYASTNDY